MGDIEKPKTHLVSKAAAPETWYIKFLRPVWRKPHNNDSHGLIDLVDDSSVIIRRGTLVVENIYKCRPYALSRFETSPKFAIVPIEMSAGARPKPEASLLRAFSKSTSYIHPDEVNEIMNPKHGRRKSFSFFSFSSLGRLCNVAVEDSSSTLAHHNEGGRKKGRARSEPTSRSSPWFLLRCVRSLSSRSRRSRQGSLEHLKKTDATDDSSCTEIMVTEPVDTAAPLQLESWTGDDPKVWSMDLTAYGEVVKCLVEDGPPNLKASTLSDMQPNLIASTRSDMISETETDDAPMIREDEFDEFDAPGTAPWSLSVSSSCEFWRKEKKIIPECTSNALVPYSGELDSVDIGNISDSQSLLRAKVFGVEMFRKQCQVEKRREEETKKLLFSLDEALDQYNHKRMITESDPGDDSKCESPNYELFNSPVFESFLESSTKAWETDSRTLRLLDCKPAPASEPDIRELHCVTVQPPNLIMDTRKPKRSLSACEDRIHHPQGEEHMILNLARLQIDELNSRKKHTNFNTTKPRSRGYRQQRSLQNGAESSSVSPRPPIPTGNVIKESVAVVVESSYDPYADFRDSMIDMIVDQNIQQTSDLEELLQCYLALNEPDYHQVIIEVFSDVWHELFQKKP